MNYQKLVRTTPENVHVPSEYIMNFIDACEKNGIELHNLMIAKDEKVIFEGHAYPYSANIPHYVHSMTKAFTNTAAGIAYSLGLLRLEDSVLSFFPEYAPENPTEYQKAMTVKDLITMRSGMDKDINGSEFRTIKTSWIQRYFQQPVPYKPGSHYFYCSGNTYMTSAIVQKVTGMTAQDLIHKYLVPQLGMRPFTWAKSPEGICSGNSGISICAEDIIKFGLLYLNHGKYNGKQVISTEWIDRSLGLIDPVKRMDSDPLYNYHWFQSVSPDIYAAEGFLGQFCAIIPKLNMAVAITSATDAKPKVEADEMLYRHIVEPLLHMNMDNIHTGTSIYTSRLINQGRYMNLTPSMPKLNTPPILGTETTIYQADENETNIKRFIFKCMESEILLGIEDDRGLNWISCGLFHWKESLSGITGNYLHHEMQSEYDHIFACAWWKDSTWLSMEWRFIETAFCDYVNIHFTPEGLTFDRYVNVNSKALSCPQVHAKLLKTSKL